MRTYAGQYPPAALAFFRAGGLDFDLQLRSRRAGITQLDSGNYEKSRQILGVPGQKSTFLPTRPDNHVGLVGMADDLGRARLFELFLHLGANLE